MGGDEPTDETAGGPAAAPRAEKKSVRVTPARGRVQHEPEVRILDGWLEITVAAPEIPQGKFRFGVGRRYLAVWADPDPHERHRFIVLPRAVVPEEATVRFQNGVIDARFRLRT